MNILPTHSGENNASTVTSRSVVILNKGARGNGLRVNYLLPRGGNFSCLNHCRMNTECCLAGVAFYNELNRANIPAAQRIYLPQDRLRKFPYNGDAYPGRFPTWS